MRTKTFQTNILVNDPYDTRLFGFNTIECYTDHSAQCWSEVFFLLPKYLLLLLVFSYVYILQGSVKVKRIYGAVKCIIITLMQIVCRVCQ